MWNESESRLVEYRQYDADGRVRVRDNRDQIICDEQEFDAATCNADWIERFGYTGAMRSTYTGLHRFGERWYASQIGQFVRTDPLWYVDSPDMYGYVGFDPINRWDPTGLAGQSLGAHGRAANRPGFSRAMMVRGLGALQVLGGGAEMVAGAFGMAATLEPASTFGGAVLFVHGVDTVNAGTSTLLTGQIQPTLTEQAGRGAAEALGANEQTASYVGMGLDMSVGIGSSAFVAARPSVQDAFPRFSSLEASQTRYLPENRAANTNQVVDRVPSPTLTVGSDREMLGRSIGHLKYMRAEGYNHVDMANVFEDLVSQINRHNPSWDAQRSQGAHGAEIFAGEMGEALVISPDGGLFRGSLGEAGQFVPMVTDSGVQFKQFTN